MHACSFIIVESESVCRVSVYLSILFSPTLSGLRVTPGMFYLVSASTLPDYRVATVNLLWNGVHA